MRFSFAAIGAAALIATLGLMPALAHEGHDHEQQATPCIRQHRRPRRGGIGCVRAGCGRERHRASDLSRSLLHQRARGWRRDRSGNPARSGEGGRACRECLSARRAVACQAWTVRPDFHGDGRRHRRCPAADPGPFKPPRDERTRRVIACAPIVVRSRKNIDAARRPGRCGSRVPAWRRPHGADAPPPARRRGAHPGVRVCAWLGKKHCARGPPEWRSQPASTRRGERACAAPSGWRDLRAQTHPADIRAAHRVDRDRHLPPLGRIARQDHPRSQRQRIRAGVGRRASVAAAGRIPAPRHARAAGRRARLRHAALPADRCLRHAPAARRTRPADLDRRAPACPLRAACARRSHRPLPA